LSIPIELIYHYPWLPSLKEFFSDIASKPPSEFISTIFSETFSEGIQERIIHIFKAAFDNLEDVPYYKLDKVNIYMYLMLKILLFILDNKIITNKIANLYSKMNYNDLIQENDYNIFSICENLKLDLLYNMEPMEYGANIFKDQQEILKTNFRIHYADYLKLASKLRDEYRKLVNNALSKGYVFIQKRRLIRLIQEYIRDKIEVEENKASLNSFKNDLLNIPEFKELYENILNQWELKREEFEYPFEIGFKEGSDVSNSFPPCVNEILSKAKEGQNLIHIERLFLVFFLHALNYPVDKIIDIFATMPDFNREKTAYQVNFAKKKGYTPHKCTTLKSLNLCMATKYKDDICLNGYYSRKADVQKKITHPLFYVQLKQFRASKIENFTKNQLKKKNERK
jgi:DNA primase large subunit